jgi:hypothetical protein
MVCNLDMAVGKFTIMAAAQLDNNGVRGLSQLSRKDRQVNLSAVQLHYYGPSNLDMVLPDLVLLVGNLGV